MGKEIKREKKIMTEIVAITNIIAIQGPDGNIFLDNNSCLGPNLLETLFFGPRIFLAQTFLSTKHLFRSNISLGKISFGIPPLLNHRLLGLNVFGTQIV